MTASTLGKKKFYLIYFIIALIVLVLIYFLINNKISADTAVPAADSYQTSRPVPVAVNNFVAAADGDYRAIFTGDNNPYRCQQVQVTLKGIPAAEKDLSTGEYIRKYRDKIASAIQAGNPTVSKKTSAQMVQAVKDCKAKSDKTACKNELTRTFVDISLKAACDQTQEAQMSAVKPRLEPEARIATPEEEAADPFRQNQDPGLIQV